MRIRIRSLRLPSLLSQQQITYMAARMTVAGLETKLKERGVQTHADWATSMLDVSLDDKRIAKLGGPLMAALDPLHWESHLKHLSSRGINFGVAIGGLKVLEMMKITREDDYAKRVSFIIRETDVLRRAKHLGVEPFAIRLDDIFLLLRSCYEEDLDRARHQNHLDEEELRKKFELVCLSNKKRLAEVDEKYAALGVDCCT